MKLLAFLASATSIVAGMPDDPAPAAGAVNEFGVRLHQRLAARADQNVCFSPYSIETALAMTYAGADGATRQEMARVLGFPADDTIHSSFAALQQTLNTIPTQASERVKRFRGYDGDRNPVALKVANRLFGQETYEFEPSFLTFLEETYRAPMDLVDFAKSAPAVRQRINGWVEQQTQRRIRELLPEGLLNAATRLVLVNALYFKAPWEDEFYAAGTRPEPFHVRGGPAQNLPVMFAQRPLGYAQKPGYRVIALPYFGDQLQFIVLLPDQVKGLATVEAKLTAADLSACAKLPVAEVILRLPRFKVEPPAISLGQELQAMGMKAAFDNPPGSANFGRMAPRSEKDYLFISEVIHKAFIAVDERGTEAAAATAVVAAAGSAMQEKPKPIDFRVDRPFLYAIQHRATGACLFLGRVTDPR